MSAAAFRADLAEQRARVHLAAYSAKSKIEWDMRWMSPLDKTWRDELIVGLWAVPVLALFTPWTRDWALDFFKTLKSFDDNAPLVYLGGWAIIFAATFGIKQARRMFPGRVANIVNAMATARDDVPYYAADQAQYAVTGVDPASGVTTKLD